MKFLPSLLSCLAFLCATHAATAANPAPVKPGWMLTFADEFDGKALDAAKWNKRYKWGEKQINNELQAYVDDAFTLKKSILTINGTKAPGQYGGKDFEYRSGVITSKHHQTYGYFEIRCKMANGRGFWPAFWLLGEEGTPGVNEIDILEFLGHQPTTVHTTVHWGKSYTEGHHGHGHELLGPDFTQDFHTYAVDWDADRIIWFIDGIEVFRHKGDGVPHATMYIIANMGIGGDWPGPPDATTKFPGKFEIDYIRAYQRAPGNL